MLKALSIALLAALTGCATCHQHPAACATGVAILATSVALSVGHEDDNAMRGARHGVCDYRRCHP